MMADWEFKSVLSDDCPDPIVIYLSDSSDKEDISGDSDSNDGYAKAKTPQVQGQTTSLQLPKKTPLSMTPKEQEKKSVKEFPEIKGHVQRKISSVDAAAATDTSASPSRKKIPVAIVLPQKRRVEDFDDELEDLDGED